MNTERKGDTSLGLVREQTLHRRFLLRLVMWGIPVAAIVTGLSLAIASLGGVENPESQPREGTVRISTPSSEKNLPPPKVIWFNPRTGFTSDAPLDRDSFISGVEIPLPPLNVSTPTPSPQIP